MTRLMLLVAFLPGLVISAFVGAASGMVEYYETWNWCWKLDRK